MKRWGKGIRVCRRRFLMRKSMFYILSTNMIPVFHRIATCYTSLCCSPLFPYPWEPSWLSNDSINYHYNTINILLSPNALLLTLLPMIRRRTSWKRRQTVSNVDPARRYENALSVYGSSFSCFMRMCWNRCEAVRKEYPEVRPLSVFPRKHNRVGNCSGSRRQAHSAICSEHWRPGWCWGDVPISLT